MSIEISWHIQNKLTYLKIIGIIELDDMRSAMQQLPSYFDESDEQLVHNLLDVRFGENVVKSLKDRIEVIRPVLEHPKCGWVVLVGQTNPVANFLASTSAQIFKARFRSFKTAEEGVAFLEQVIPDIDYIPALEAEPE